MIFVVVVFVVAVVVGVVVGVLVVVDVVDTDVVSACVVVEWKHCKHSRAAERGAKNVEWILKASFLCDVFVFEP